MKPRIKENWKDVLRRAWSVRLAALAGALSGAEVLLPLFSDAAPRGAFALLSIGVSVAAMVARVVVQRNLP